MKKTTNLASYIKVSHQGFASEEDTWVPSVSITQNLMTYRDTAYQELLQANIVAPKLWIEH